MHSLRGLSLRAATLAALLPGAALAHPGHGVSSAHSHAEWIAVAAVSAIIGAVFFARRATAKREEE